MGQLRIGLTISGAVALGAYEGGALAALLAGAQAVNREDADAMRIDAIAGASAGSITAVLTARALLEGLDPIDAMYGAWVDAPALKKLRDGWTAPLSVDSTRASAAELLSGRSDASSAQAAHVTVNMALGCLRGLYYRIGNVAGAPIDATTYLDWSEFEFEPGQDVDTFYLAENGPVDVALASGAHAAAFPPRGILWPPERVELYRTQGIESFPDPPFLWYTDGGTIDNEPLGRALDISAGLDERDFDPGRDTRLHLMITPDPEDPPKGADEWSDPNAHPSWGETALRTLKLLRAQNLYDDLRRVQKTNSRIAWTGELQDALTDIIEGREPDAAGRLRATIDSIARQKQALDSPQSVQVERERRDSEIGRLVGEALSSATGLAKKRQVAMGVISPRLLPAVRSGELTTRDVLAGEFFGHFGGFLDERLRINDFAVGYRSAIEWMLDPDWGLAKHGLKPDLAARAIAAARAADRGWAADMGEKGFGDLPLRERAGGLSLAARSVLIALGELNRAI